MAIACLLGGLLGAYGPDEAVASCGDWLDPPHGAQAGDPPAMDSADSHSAGLPDRPCRGPNCERNEHDAPIPAPAVPAPAVERWAVSGAVAAPVPAVTRPATLHEPTLHAVLRPFRVFRPPC